MGDQTGRRVPLLPVTEWIDTAREGHEAASRGVERCPYRCGVADEADKADAWLAGWLPTWRRLYPGDVPDPTRTTPPTT